MTLVGAFLIVMGLLCLLAGAACAANAYLPQDPNRMSDPGLDKLIYQITAAILIWLGAVHLGVGFGSLKRWRVARPLGVAFTMFVAICGGFYLLTSLWDINNVVAPWGFLVAGYLAAALVLLTATDWFVTL